MFFNYLIDYPLRWLNRDSVRYLKDLIIKADKELNYGMENLFADIPFNLVNDLTLRELFKETEDKLLNYVQNSRGSKDEERYVIPDLYKYRELLEESFCFQPTSLFAKKGVSSSGNEVLILDEGCEDMPPLFIRTVYPLCWRALKVGKDFPLAKGPLHPVFFRYMQEPVAVAMTLAAAEVAFKEDPHALNYIIHYIERLPMNYRAGILLHELNLHLRWKDWKDGKARCERKIDVMEHWVDILSDRYKDPDKEDVIRTWGELFDISAAEIGMIMNSAFYAPVICEGDEIPSVLAGLLEYVSKNQKDFLIDSILTSDHPLAVIIKALATGTLLVDAALHKAPSMSVQELSEFISSHLNGWSLSREVKTGNYRIYGKVAKYNVLKPANSSSPVEQAH